MLEMKKNDLRGVGGQAMPAWDLASQKLQVHDPCVVYRSWKRL